MTPRERAEALVRRLENAAELERTRAAKAREDGKAAFHADDMHASATCDVEEMLHEGKAIAYADAATDVRMLALWIPEG